MSALKFCNIKMKEGLARDSSAIKASFDIYAPLHFTQKHPGHEYQEKSGFCAPECYVLGGRVADLSVATSDVLTSDLMFSEKSLMSDVLATNLMLTGLLFLLFTFPFLLE